MLAIFEVLFSRFSQNGDAQCGCGANCRCGENCACSPDSKCSPACTCAH